MADEIKFTGALAPGSTLTINARTRTALLNGENALHLVEGLHAFGLPPGEHQLIYEDDEAGRTVRIQITKRDRWE